MAKIRELMVTETITATSNESVAEAAQRMSSNRVGAVLVVDRGVLRGLLSERDVLTRVVAEGRDPRETRVGDVATRVVVTIDVNAPLRSVLGLFREKKFRHLPVLEAGKPVGILSTRDFLDYLVDGLERFIDDATYRRELAQGVDPYDHFGGSYGK
ncbi:MAG TPA: CBS domain-containing protein [Candidatus Binatia bacterium]|nr:CBS domain-containing protein [Candidatus Binatia bacterium]